DEGEAEFRRALAENDPVVTLDAARAYRELGMIERAISLAESVHQTSEPPHTHSAALFIASSSDDLDAVETWLGRADTRSPQVRIRLLSVEAHRLAREG